MFDDSPDRTASLMTPTRLAQMKARPRPDASPAAWLDLLAAGAGGGHVRRLLDLRHQLSALLHAGEVRTIVGGCQALHEALEQVDFSLVQPRGWLARMTGGRKEAAARFAAQQRRVVQAGDALANEVRTLQKEQEVQRTAVERTLLDCEVELRAIEKILEQGTRWLQDMRTQIEARQPGTDEAAQRQVRDDTARCELLVTRLHSLRNAASATQQVLQHGRGACSARTALAARCRHSLDEEWPAWRRQAASLADEAAAHGCAAQDVEAARATLEALRSALQEAGAQARAVQAQDRTLGEEVAALQVPLLAAG
jgi:chromosome segregation ATPase